MNYDIDYFIAKFEAIPEDLWCVGSLTQGERRCAIGHCRGADFKIPTKESLNLAFVVGLDPRHRFAHIFVESISDGKDPDFTQETPKLRILAWLRALKEFYR